MRELNLSRRNLLKAAALTGAASAFSGVPSGLIKEARAVEIQSAGEEKIVKTCCRACIQNCGVLAHVRNGRVVKLEGNPEYPFTKGAMCAKGLSGIQALYHPNRNKYPMVRVGARGENRWKRISWKEAIDTLAKKLMDCRAKYGAEAVMCTTGGGGNPAFRSIARFCNIFGTPNWFEPGCSQCFLPRTLAFDMQWGGPTTSIADEHCGEIYAPDATKTFKNLVSWGTDVSNSCPAGGGRALVELRAAGVKTVSVDPRFVPDAARADVWLPIRPGTDVALMLAWISYILENKLYDADFCLKWTNMPYLVNTKTKMFLHGNDIAKDGNPKDYVVWDKKTNSAKPLTFPWNDSYDVELDGEHTVNGIVCKTGMRMLRERAKPWTIERASAECGDLDPKKVVEAINIFAHGPGGLALGVATDQSPNSVEAAKCAVILNAIMGYIEKPGTLLHRRAAAGPFITNSLATRSSKCLPEGQLTKRLGGNEYKGLGQWDAGHIDSIYNAIMTGKPYQPRIWIERSGNKMNVIAEPQKWVKAFERMEYIVHMFLYPTSFTNYCDMVLPMTEWLETNHIVQNLNMIFARQEVVHTWETVDETLVWSKILLRCAELGHENCIKAKDAKYMGADLPLWNSMEELLDGRLKPLGLTWKSFLKDHNPLVWKPYKEWARYETYKDINPKTGKPKGFRTPSGKIEIYADGYITLSRTGKPYATQPLPPASHDYDPLPFYMRPAESPLNEYGKKYPLTMTNGRLPMYHHGTLRNNPYLRELYPVPEIWVNPVAAEKYGIKQGDWVWVENDRNKITARARVTEGVAPGTVYMERFWLPEKLQTTGGWREMNVNTLSRSTAPFNECVGTYTLRGYQVKISKADGAPEGVWTKPEQFKPWLPQPSDPTPNPEF